MTDDPLRLKILKAISAKIATITPGNGFVDDLSGDGSVVRGRLFIGDDEPLPMVALNEPPMAIEQARGAPQNPNSTGEWDILIQGWVEDDPPNLSDKAYVLEAQVRQVLASEMKKPSGRPGSGNGPDFFGFGPIIITMRIGAPVVRAPDGTSRTACFYLMLTLQIVEDMTKPFG
jgi:hypothetical protein